MNAHFPRIISLLRKERHISQKEAAAELGISQALLSHYEKGIRECGLEFVVKVANYYSVSCDYLLGRSADPTGMTLTVDELPEPDSAGKDNMTKASGLLPLLNKKLISNSLNILYDLLTASKNKALTQEISIFLMLAVYRVFRLIYSADPKNAQALFSTPKIIADGYADAAMRFAHTNAAAVAAGEIDKLPQYDESAELSALSLTTQTLSTRYPLFATSLLNLIKNAEDHMHWTMQETR